MPDFDIDFCQDRREEVKLYVQDKYGTDRVAQIITFDPCKQEPHCVMLAALRCPTDRLTVSPSLIPSNPANPVTIAQALKASQNCGPEAQ